MISRSAISDNVTGGSDDDVSDTSFYAEGFGASSSLLVSRSTSSGNKGDGPALLANFYDNGGSGTPLAFFGTTAVLAWPTPSAPLM